MPTCASTGMTKMRTKLECACGKTLEVWAENLADLKAVALANNWHLLNFEGNDCFALCPSCDAVAVAGRRHNREVALRD